MAAVIPVLARAAGVGIVLGGVVFRKKLTLASLIITTTACVALRAIAWYFGLSAACGIVVGLVGRLCTNPNTDTEPLIAAGMFGGVIGYLAPFAWLGVSS